MRVFCHASDHEDALWRHLPTLLLLSKPLILWAPSAASLSKSFASGDSIIDAKGMLDLVEAGYVEVHAREAWFDPVRRKNMRFRGGDEWVNGFDGELYAKFRAHGSGFNNIFGHPLGSGDTWATQQIDGHTEAYQRALELVRVDQVTRSTKAKAAQLGNGSETDVARVLLRDAKNHIEALSFVNAGPDVEPDPHWWTRPHLCEDSVHFQMPTGQPFDLERLRKISAIIEEVTRPTSVKELLRLKERFGESLRSEIWQLFADENDPVMTESIDLETVAQRKGWIQTLVGKGSVEGPAQAVGLVTGALGLAMSLEPVSVIGLLAALVPPLKNTAVNYGYFPLGVSESEASVSFKLAHKRVLPWFSFLRAPTIVEARKISARLCEIAGNRI